MALLLLLPDALPRPWKTHTAYTQTHTHTERSEGVCCCRGATSAKYGRRKKRKRKKLVCGVYMHVGFLRGEEKGGRVVDQQSTPSPHSPFFLSLQYLLLLLPPLPLSKSIGREGRDRCISPQIELAKTCHIQLD